MTALRKYQRLESPGLWREHPSAQLREVIVGLRDATLVLSDPKTEMALSQWSLPALQRLNPGKVPALFAPGLDDDETLEIEDSDMTAALETVRSALERRRPKPGRLRGVLLSGFGAVLGALAIFWLPDQLIDYTTAMLPPATRADLGKLALQELTELTGSPCSTPAGTDASVALGLRLNRTQPPHVLVLRELATPLHLPGDLVLLPARLLETADGPEAIAGYVLAETLRAAATDPTHALLTEAGLLATVRLLASGAIDPQALDGYGQTLLTQQAPVDLPTETLLAAFKTAGVSATPYAYALDKTGESTLPLIEADPLPQGSQPAVLDDAGWLNLQAICAG